MAGKHRAKANRARQWATALVIGALSIGGSAVGMPGASAATASGIDTAYTYSPTATPTPTPATGRTASLISYGAKCDGVTNDQAALQRAINDVASQGGGTVLLPVGKCRIVQTSGAVSTTLSGSVVLQGSSGGTTLQFDTDQPGQFRQLFRVKGADAGLRNLDIVRTSDVYGIMIDVFASTGFTMDGVTLDGQGPKFPSGIHGIRLSANGSESIKDLKILNSAIRNTAYGLFQDSAITSLVDGITVDHSTFSGNGADDLEFNAPSGTMRNVNVTNSTFTGNVSTSANAGAGFAVGLANVQNSLIQGNSFEGYPLDPVHIEDRSAFVKVDSNRFTHNFTRSLDYACDVFIVSGSHDITVTRNDFDLSANTNNLVGVYIGSGGTDYPVPYTVNVTRNQFKLNAGSGTVTNNGGQNVTVDSPPA
jgi:hypothetical protein